MKYNNRIKVIFYMTIIAIVIFPSFAKKKYKNLALAPPAPPGVPLKSNSFAERGCGTMKAVPNLSREFINKFPAWYVPMAHKHFYYGWAEALINRSIVPSEMPGMCMKWLFLSPTKPNGKYNVIVGGLKQGVTQLCMDTGFQTETCEAPMASPEHHRNADNVGTIVATDNKRWFLLMRCVKKTNKDWALFVSDKNPLDAALYKTIAKEVKNHDFDLKNVENGKYDKCPTT